MKWVIIMFWSNLSARWRKLLQHYWKGCYPYWNAPPADSAFFCTMFLKVMLKSPAQSLPPLFSTKYNLSLLFAVLVFLYDSASSWSDDIIDHLHNDRLISWSVGGNFFTKIYLHVSWSTNQLNTNWLKNISLSKYSSLVISSTNQLNTNQLNTDQLSTKQLKNQLV